MNRFSVVIPSRNATNLVACVRAIREAGETCRIIVVDDGVEWPWEDHTPEWLGAVDVFDGDRPFCFARNVNIGIRAAGEDDVILLNDDALLKTPEGFSRMRTAMVTVNDAIHSSSGESGYGIIGAACNNVGNVNQHQRTEGPVLRNEPRMLCFVCVYIPRSTINTVGLLDQRFIDYGLEDDDYSLRVRHAGLKLGVFDGCFVDHGSLTSSFRGPAGVGGDFTTNMRRFIEKHGVDNWNQPRETSQFRHLFPND